MFDAMDTHSVYIYKWYDAISLIHDTIWKNSASYNILTTNLENDLLDEMKIRTCGIIKWGATSKMCLYNVNV